MIGRLRYHEHDELRFLYGDDWQRRVPTHDEALPRPEPAIAIPAVPPSEIEQEPRP